MINKKPIWPKFFYIKDDGGKESGVKAYCLIEWKRGFSICLLRFSDGSREAFHSHAFNAFTWFLSGKVLEERLLKDLTVVKKYFTPSIKPKYTKRNNVHKVTSFGTTWALSFRGPWEDTWYEQKYKDNKLEKMVLTHNRVIV